ncbi:4Fe-4S binding protein [Pseudothermotoga sp. U03pept]
MHIFECTGCLACVNFCPNGISRS